MDNFLVRFFPKVAEQAKMGSSTSTDAYCTYSDQNLQAFTSSLFLAAAFAGLAGSYSTRYAASNFACTWNASFCMGNLTRRHLQHA